jgi:hypothetical protein
MRGCSLPDPRTPRKPSYLDRLLETSPARRPAAVGAPHQIRWAPGFAPGAGTEPEPRDDAAGRPYARSAAALTGSGPAGRAAARQQRHPAGPGVPPQRRASDPPATGPAAAGRAAGEARLGSPPSALAQLQATSLPLDPPGPAKPEPGRAASDATRQAGSLQSTLAVTREDRRTQPQGAPSVHIGSVEVRLTAPVPPAAPPPRPPAPAVARLSRPRPPFGLGQV